MAKTLSIGTVNVANFDQMLDYSYWQFVVHGQRVIKQMKLVSPRLQLANMKVSRNDGSDCKTISVLLKPGRRLMKLA